MKKYLTLLFINSVFIMPSFAQDKQNNQDSKNDVSMQSCTIEFEYNKAIVDEASLSSCMKQFDLKNLLYIDVFATSTPKGGLTYNHNLSKRRADNIKKTLEHYGVPISIRNGGSSYVYGKQGTITFVVYTEKKQETCQANSQLIQKNSTDQSTTSQTSGLSNVTATQQVTKENAPNNDVYFGIGETFIMSPLSDYAATNMFTYNIGLNHKFIPFTLFRSPASLYIGGDLTFANTENTLSATSTSPKLNSHYIRNNYALVLGIERNFSFLNSLSAFWEIGPAAQERIFILTVASSGSAVNGYAARTIGVVSNLGLKYRFLQNNSTLERVGIEALFARLSVNTSYGPSIDTDKLTYKPQTETIDINAFSWGALLSIGASY